VAGRKESRAEGEGYRTPPGYCQRCRPCLLIPARFTFCNRSNIGRQRRRIYDLTRTDSK
jgi:hypothetical protein